MGAQRSDANHELSAIQERLVALEQLLAGQQQRMAEQEAEIGRLHNALAAANDAPALILPPSSTSRPSAGLASRRSLLKLGGVAAAAAGVAATAAAVGRNVPSAYAATATWTNGTVSVDSETLVKPSSSGYPSTDILQLQLGTGTVYSPLGVQAHAAKAALTAYDTTTNNIGVYASSSTGFGLFGVTDTGTAATGAGLNGTANSTGTGVSGNSQSGIGVQGNSSAGLGGSFVGGQAPLALGLSGGAGAPASGTHVPGEIYLDSTATLFVCISGGTPGAWARVGAVLPGYTGGVAHFLPAPIRIVDTRGGAPITNGGVPLAGGSTLVVQVTGTAVGGVSVPAGAKAVLANLTALPFAGGDLTIWADGVARPNASNLNYTPGINVANFVMSALSPAGKADIYAHVGSTNVILDVAGFIV